MNAVWKTTLYAALLLTSVGTKAEDTQTLITSLRQIADGSKCTTHSWKNRGIAPKTYIEGVTLVFARAICHPDRSDVKVVSRGASVSTNPNDALVVYKDTFAAAGMRNDDSGVDTLRHSYVLLIGLGMMESSGRFCEGRDVSECFTTADSAEAGLFQTSYGARVHSATLVDLFNVYRASSTGCMLDVFRDSIVCSNSTKPQQPMSRGDERRHGDR
jgi:hypothetical protein